MRRTIGAILVSGAVLAMSAAVGVAQTQVSLPKIEESHLVVQTDAQVEIPADTVVIRFSIVGEAETLPAAKSEHLAIAGAVAEAVRALGIEAEQIESSDYSSRRNTRWDEATQTDVFVSHMVSTGLEIETSKFDLVGGIVDAALGAGAARVSSFEFDSTRRVEARAEAIAKATAQAKSDARVLADAAGVTLGVLRGVYLDPSDYQWELGVATGVRGDRFGGGGQSVFHDEAEELVFRPEPVHVYATVRLVYETKPNE